MNAEPMHRPRHGRSDSDALVPIRHIGHIGHLRKASLAHAKAHLSELVDAAEHRNRRIIILRHGKPAAAIVPVDVAAPKRARAPLSDDDVQRSVAAFVDEFSGAEPEVSAVADLRQGRR
jgi:prevent-host-death family protein